MAKQLSSVLDMQPAKINTLPDQVLLRAIFSALDSKDQSALARTSNRYHSLFNSHIRAAKLLRFVSRGAQRHAAESINRELLLIRTNVTDYSGRTFNHITAYEYAYWSKDMAMCRILDTHMDCTARARTIESIEAIKRRGLTYTQHGIVHSGSKHFDFTPLQTAYVQYLALYQLRPANTNLKTAWFAIGLMQREVPAWVAQQYCHDSRCPEKLSFYSWDSRSEERWFPLKSATSGPGFDFALSRGNRNYAWSADTSHTAAHACAKDDLTAVTKMAEESSGAIYCSM